MSLLARLRKMVGGGGANAPVVRAERSDALPFFRFHPGAYEPDRAFAESDEPCAMCGECCGLKYSGNLYTARKVDPLCPYCIAEGRLDAHLGGSHHGFHDVEIIDADPEAEDELMLRTPGVACYNPFDWPVIDGMPLAFLGYGEDSTLITNPAVQAAAQEALDEVGETFAGPTPYLLIFREVDGTRYRCVIDLD